jgi:hypothetical protein
MDIYIFYKTLMSQALSYMATGWKTRDWFPAVKTIKQLYLRTQLQIDLRWFKCVYGSLEQRKNFRTATLFTINLTRNVLGFNAGLRCERTDASQIFDSLPDQNSFSLPTTPKVLLGPQPPVKSVCTENSHSLKIIAQTQIISMLIVFGYLTTDSFCAFVYRNKVGRTFLHHHPISLPFSYFM